MEKKSTENKWRPGPRTSARNVNDPRVGKTLSRLRRGYIELLDNEDADDISVLRLSERSGVDRKTFYLHYRNMDDMKFDVCDMKASELIERLTGDFSADIATIYDYLDGMESGVYALLTSMKEHDFSDRFLHQVFTSDAFSSYYQHDDDDVVEGYLYSIVYIYEENRRSEDPLETSELAEYATRLMMHGISGIEKSGD